MSDLDYYDKILVGIVGSLVGGISLGLVTSISFHAAVIAGAVVATVFTYDAMYRNPPLPPTDVRVQAAAIVWHAVLLALILSIYVG